MIPATNLSFINPMGAAAVASIRGKGKLNPSIRVGINEDEAGLKSADTILSRAVELAELIYK
jgi:hypothetical protein